MASTTPTQKSATAQTASDEKSITAFAVDELLNLQSSESKWIISPLLKIGGQMLLAAPPKCGKSLLASEIAIQLARPFFTGETRALFKMTAKGDFKGLSVERPQGEQFSQCRGWKVLFFSLEMREAEVGERLRKQIEFIEGCSAKEESRLDSVAWSTNLLHIFGLKPIRVEERGPRQDLKIVRLERNQENGVSDGPDFETIRGLIEEHKPEVVIFDTLIQLHGVDENNNVQMKEVLRTLCRLCVIEAEDKDKKLRDQPVAHIVLHHTRKDSSQARAPLSPEIMRGAGSVHGVADVVMLARQEYKRKSDLEVHVSSRSSDIPNFRLSRTAGLTHEHNPTARSTISKKSIPYQVIRKFIQDGGDKGTRIKLPTLLEKVNEQLAAHEYKDIQIDSLRKYMRALQDLDEVRASQRPKKKGNEKYPPIEESIWKLTQRGLNVARKLEQDSNPKPAPKKAKKTKSAKSGSR